MRRFVYLCKAAARLEMALCNYAFQKVVSKGYMPVCTPDLVRASVLQRCGFQPRAENTQVRQIALDQAGLASAGWSELAGRNGNIAMADVLLAIQRPSLLLSLITNKAGRRTSIDFLCMPGREAVARCRECCWDAGVLSRGHRHVPDWDSRGSTGRHADGPDHPRGPAAHAHGGLWALLPGRVGQRWCAMHYSPRSTVLLHSATSLHAAWQCCCTLTIAMVPQVLC